MAVCGDTGVSHSKVSLSVYVSAATLRSLSRVSRGNDAQPMEMSDGSPRRQEMKEAAVKERGYLVAGDSVCMVERSMQQKESETLN